MSQSLGPYTNRYGLVFGFDTGDTGNTYKGEPTTNLSYNNGQGGSEYLAAVSSWVNAGSWIFNDNETDVSKPLIMGLDTSNLRILSGRNTTESGSVHFGCGFTYLNPSTTYTVSVWYRQNRAGVSQPYLRTNITNAGLGNLSYNGNTDSSTWPVNKWIRITASGTTASNENGLYISNYIGTYVNDKIWYFGHQVEQKDHMTPLVVGTRSGTQGLFDITNNKTIDISNLSFNSSASPIFDGTNDGIIIPTTSFNRVNGQELTVEVIMKAGRTGGQYQDIAVNRSDAYYNWMLYQHASDGSIQLHGAGQYKSTYIPPIGQYIHVVATVNANQVSTLYINGVVQQTVTSFSYAIMTTPDLLCIGVFGNSRYEPYLGNIDVVKIHDRAIPQSEVLKNYNNYKKRFNL